MAAQFRVQFNDVTPPLEARIQHALCTLMRPSLYRRTALALYAIDLQQLYYRSCPAEDR